MRILVTGASGFVGATLVPRLLAEGHRVQVLARDPAHTQSVLAAVPEIEVIRGDVLSGEGLQRALKGIEVAYYLIHSMESQPAGAQPPSSFPERERLGATNFATHARQAGIRRIVYLGGPMPRGSLPQAPASHRLTASASRHPAASASRHPAASASGHPAARVSRHLTSRAEVERILFEHVPESVALRASIVIGARSRSFRLLVRLVERLPVLALPAWRTFRTQPIDARDVTEILLATAIAPAIAGRRLDIGGPKALTYEELLQQIAEIMILPRPTLGLKFALTSLTARLAAALVGEDPELIVALMESLESGDLLVGEDHAAELLGVELHSVEDAVECALREWEAVEPLAAR